MAKEIDTRIMNIELTIVVKGLVAAQSLQDLLDGKITRILIDDAKAEQKIEIYK